MTIARGWLGLALALLAAAPVSAQQLKVEKFTLPNGMVVVLHEDRTLPQVAVNTWYRVGALDEPPGRSGFAHLFEHLMFMGTRRVPGNQFDVLMETGGGANNASTDLYRTNYFSWGPSALLPLLLWLDADRLEDMGLTMTQDKLDKQREVVRNERRQTTENTPYGNSYELMFNVMFPPGHPYHDGVIGTHGDLEAATVGNVRDFFAIFYVPNNASLVVAGDFDSATVKPLVEKLFGTLPAGAPVQRRQVAPVKLDGVRRISTIDKVELPKTMIVYHSPIAYAEGDAELQLAAEILSEGKSSRLYKRLVIDEKLAVEVDASQNSSQLQSLFTIEVITRPDADLTRVEQIIDEEVARLAQSGPTADELERRQAQVESRLLNSMQDLRFRADRLNEYEYFYGEPNSFEKDLARFRGASAEKIQRTVAAVLTPAARAFIRVYPEEPQRAPSPRDEKPAAATAGEFRPPAPESFELANGLPVLLWKRSELPLVSLALVRRPGGALDDAARAGLANLAIHMLDEGAGERDALQFGDALQALGAQFSAGSDHETLTVSLNSLKRTFAKSAALWADAIQSPRLAATDWDRVKSLHVEGLRQAESEPTVVAQRVAARVLFGEANPYGWPSDGLPSTVEPLTLEQVKAKYHELLSPDGATLLIAGDLTVADAKAVLDPLLGKWRPAQRGGGATADFGAMAAGEGLRLYVVDRPGAVQTVVRFQAPGVKYSDARRVALRTLNTLLGGTFTSRLNQNLREDKGYTYGARSRYEMEPSSGAFVATAEVQTEVTGAAIGEFLKEFSRLRGGDVSEAEAGKARETMINGIVQSFSTLRGFVGLGAELTVNGLPMESVAADLAAIAKVSAAELNALAKDAIALERGVLVLVGDRAAILPQLKDLGLPAPQFVDSEGKPAKEPG